MCSLCDRNKRRCVLNQVRGNTHKMSRSSRSFVPVVSRSHQRIHPSAQNLNWQPADNGTSRSPHNNKPCRASWPNTQLVVNFKRHSVKRACMFVLCVCCVQDCHFENVARFLLPYFVWLSSWLSLCHARLRCSSAILSGCPSNATIVFIRR